MGCFGPQRQLLWQMMLSHHLSKNHKELFKIAPPTEAHFLIILYFLKEHPVCVHNTKTASYPLVTKCVATDITYFEKNYAQIVKPCLLAVFF